MAISDESTGMYMPVTPAGGGFGGDWAWILLLLVLFGGGFGGFGGGFDGMYPWMNQSAQISDGFRDAAMNSNILGIEGKLADMAAQFSTCCCENRLAAVQTQNVVATEGAATRAAIQSQTQAILDKMCQQEIDNLKAQNIALQNQVNMLNLSASQTAQTAALIADNTAQTNYLISKLTPVV